MNINNRNLICGIEVMDASENLGISKSILKNIKNVKISVSYKTNYVHNLLIINFMKKGKDVNVPIPLTLNLGHKKPKKDILIYN